MARHSLLVQECNAFARRVRHELGREIRAARLDAGTSMRTAAARVELSHSQLGRIERGAIDHLTVEQLARACAAVGLQLVIRAVPGAGGAIDAGQLALLGRLQRHLPHQVPMHREVPLPVPGDRRAWDAVLGLDPDDAAVEAEARLRDLQALERRSMLKLRDSGLRRLILLVADTVHNRQMLTLHREDLRRSFPLDTRAVLHALRAGRTPGSNGIVIL